MATITATVSDPDRDAVLFWETFTESDTTAAARWPGGEGFAEVVGTFGGATIQLQFATDNSSFYDVDTDTAPDGGKFTAAGIAKFDLPIGYIKFTASGGSSQDVDIKVTPKRSI